MGIKVMDGEGRGYELGTVKVSRVAALLLPRSAKGSAGEVGKVRVFMGQLHRLMVLDGHKSCLLQAQVEGAALNFRYIFLAARAKTLKSEDEEGTTRKAERNRKVNIQSDDGGPSCAASVYSAGVCCRLLCLPCDFTIILSTFRSAINANRNSIFVGHFSISLLI